MFVFLVTAARNVLLLLKFPPLIRNRPHPEALAELQNFRDLTDIYLCQKIGRSGDLHFATLPVNMGSDEMPCQGAQLACMQNIMTKIGKNKN